MTGRLNFPSKRKTKPVRTQKPKVFIKSTQFRQKDIANGQREDGQQERSYEEESIG
jgi:hypothetical protein